MKLLSNRYIKSLSLPLVLGGLMFTSCKKLIEIPSSPKNQLTTDRVFSDSANIISAIAGLYSNFGISSSYSPGMFSGAITVYTGLTGDEMMPGSDIYTAPAFYSNNILPDNTNVRSLWSAAYKSIFDANICMEGISGSNAISEGLKCKLIAELKVVRAFCYFNMVNLWGGVPIVTSTDYKATQSIPRASVDSVYNFISADLQGAIADLAPEYPSAGRARPNRYVAQSLLSKVYLYTGQYQQSIDEATDVIDSKVYGLPALSNVFLKGSTEAIWQLPANGTSRATLEASAFIPYSTATTPSYVLAPQLLNAFEAGDQRKSTWTRFNDLAGGTTVYYPYKYRNLQSTETPVEDYMFLRLADVYLIRAEALANRENIIDALKDLNAVRGRAGLKDTSIASKNDLLKAIWHERQVELFCEWGNRWFDLKRTKTIDEVLSTAKTTWKSWAALFPIPTAERQANPALTPNPGPQ